MKNTSLLPKLLAKENVTVRHGNYSTAWFDIKDRVLGLPLWEDMHKDVYDLFVGHEVGHALETPFEGWHDSPEKLKGCPRSYINVVEDARIERKIQARYPGLVGSFNRGYKQLLDKEFFGDLTDLNWDEIKLIDKINLKTKLGTKLEVPFSDAENVFLTRSLNTSTFEEVLDLVRDILEFTKENTPELIQQPEPQVDDTDNNQEESNDDGPSSNGHDDYESPEEDSSQPGHGQPEDSGEEDTETEEEKNVAISQPVHNEDDVSITDEIFRQKEKELIHDTDGQPLYIDELSKEILDKAVVPYSRLKTAREEFKKQDNYGTEDYYGATSDEEFKSYLKTLKKNVSFAVREFEMRKSAYQYSRAQTSKTGTIDVNKLWSYKTNEDIFLQATKLADAKNHGMMLLIDMSGSMSTSMKYVMDQVLHLVTFCKAVNIPFEVYGFTSSNPDLDWQSPLFYDGCLEMDGLCMPLITSSSLSKADYLDSLQHIFRRAKCHSYYRLNKYEEWGSTPLNQALVVSHHLIKKFKRKHNVEKMNFITFTDGDANNISRHTDPGKTDIRPDGNKIMISVDGSKVTSSRWRTQLTKSLLKNIQKKYQCNNIGFFMANDGGDWRNKIYDISGELNISSSEYKSQAGREYRKNKCVTVNNVLGYTEYYLVKGGHSLDTEQDEFEVATDATQANIRNAFKKFAKSKKLNKVLMTKFGKAVA